MEDVANEFRPGHPVIFWMFIAVLIFGFISGTKALVTLDTCDGRSDGVKHWRVLPPEWVCSSGGFEWSRQLATTEHWFEPLAEFMGPAYLRYSFTKGTEQEVEFLVDELGIQPGQRVLDVGCGPGRHAHALARRGIEVVGVDISQTFVELANTSAPPGASFVRGDARRLAYDAEFDAVLSLCQGGFGLVHDGEDDDRVVLEGMARAVRPGGAVALSAFSSYFAVRFLEEGEVFDARTGVNLEHTTLRNEAGEEADFESRTSCYTPRELRLLVAAVGLRLRHLWSVAPGAYRRDPPDLEHPEFLVIAERRP